MHNECGWLRILRGRKRERERERVPARKHWHRIETVTRGLIYRNVITFEYRANTRT